MVSAMESGTTVVSSSDAIVSFGLGSLVSDAGLSTMNRSTRPCNGD